MTKVKKIATDFGTIHVTEAGSGPPLLLVHGLLSSHESFEPLFGALTASHRVLAFDFPDHGESTISSAFVPSWQGYCDVLHAVADELGLERFDLCGHSVGGGLCALFAAKYPNRVNKLILIDSVTAQFKMPLKVRVPLIPLFGDFVFRVVYGPRLFLDYFRNDVFFDAKKINVKRILSFYAGFDKNRAVVLQAIRATANSQPIVASLSKIEAETLLIWGRHDPLVPLFVGNETVRKIKRAKLEIIENCGHSPMEEAPGETADSILDFLH